MKFSFLVESLHALGIRVTGASQNELGSVPSLSILWNSSRKIAIKSFLKVWQNSVLNLSGPGLFSPLVGWFLMTSSISLCDMALYPFFCWGTSGLFSIIWLFTNKPAMNIVEHMSFWYGASLSIYSEEVYLCVQVEIFPNFWKTTKLTSKVLAQFFT